MPFMTGRPPDFCDDIGLILPRFPGHLDMRLNLSIEVLHEELAS